MLTTLGKLKKTITESLREGWATPHQPVGRVVGTVSGREEIGSLGDSHLTDEELDDAMPEHLRDEDIWGPVPPTAGEPYVSQDPYVRDYNSF